MLQDNCWLKNPGRNSPFAQPCTIRDVYEVLAFSIVHHKQPDTRLLSILAPCWDISYHIPK